MPRISVRRRSPPLQKFSCIRVKRERSDTAAAKESQNLEPAKWRMANTYLGQIEEPFSLIASVIESNKGKSGVFFGQQWWDEHLIGGHSLPGAPCFCDVVDPVSRRQGLLCHDTVPLSAREPVDSRKRKKIT
jgi:hypothetical protein